jgi:hypothetical protein
MSVRRRLAEAAAEDYELIRQALRQGIQAKHEVWVTCRSCNKRTKKDVTDQSAVNRAIEIWLDQGLGRPLQEQRDQYPSHPPDVTLEDVERWTARLRAEDLILGSCDLDELRQMVALWETHKQQRNGSKP